MRHHRPGGSGRITRRGASCHGVDATPNQPMPPGVFGDKLLVNVLISRTQPLIRYELSDRVAALADTCPDGMPFGLLAGIEGREEEILTLGGVTVHPNVFHKVLERLPIAGWQVIDEGDGLRVLLAGAGRAWSRA